jgi:hypothetical protein
MGFLTERCSVFPLNDDVVLQCLSFYCGDEDLDDFFNHSTSNYERELYFDLLRIA